ncbi:DUF5320 domain-containing protein [Desulfoscipio gibsoniae]|uniref:DUF5320 domain-containing protein n=1 Tax=Desulfoscipio gibsoniae DSM 7213 TaxID=767817 RepID=R4KQ49_9FIRM|nr:DUF5320 domain-containing protein [Desulfoscipio gibsoniae]AGL02700.1 hypothetical protein Desgi_3355 [Desulfoscipio gibsoniae DSM 7213]
MPRGGFGYGYGYGMGNAPGFGFGRGMRGNYSANCRMYPWMPRHWWANSNVQNNMSSPFAAGFPQESEYLKNQAELLKAQLGEIEKRLNQLDKKDIDNNV